MLNILCLLALVVHGHAYLSCLDDSGAQVDHWTGIKGNDNYTMYYYNEATKLFKLSPFMVDQTARGAIMTTLQPLYDSPANETMAYIMWNDAPPGDYTPSATYAHSKGILATDGVQGFMLTHSMPNWPEAPDCGRAPSDNPGCNGTNPGIFPSDRYAQSMACVTVSAATVNQMANTIRINYPWVYGLNMPEALKVQQQYMDDLINKRKISKTNETASNALFSLGGVRYTQFAKSKSWGEDLWDDLVAPYYGSPMYVETWINGSGGPMSSTCENSTFPNKKVNETFDIYQVSGIDMPDGNDWTNTQDHSKWGVAKSTEIGNPEVFDTSQVCIGDINRMCSQEKRGGGALCTQDAGLLNAFMDIITGVEACYSKDPCASSTGSKCYWCPLPVPSPAPTAPEPTELPTPVPSRLPTALPSTEKPTYLPTLSPTVPGDTRHPTFFPTLFPSFFPTLSPTVPGDTLHPTHRPTHSPSHEPTQSPGFIATSAPSIDASAGAADASNGGFLDMKNNKVYIGFIVGSAFLFMSCVGLTKWYKKSQIKAKKQKLADQGHLAGTSAAAAGGDKQAWVNQENDLDPGQSREVQNPVSFADLYPEKDYPAQDWLNKNLEA
mgnify:CR=1 FL=1